jgi:predicted ester cyclase
MEDAAVSPARSIEELLVYEALALMTSDGEARLEEIVHPEYRDHTLPGLPRGSECFRMLRRRLARAFADIELIPHDVVVQGCRVAVRLRFRGLHVAPYAGLEPCGRTVEMDEIHIWRLMDSKLIEHWACRDERAALLQMGAGVSWPDGYSPRPAGGASGAPPLPTLSSKDAEDQAEAQGWS